MEYVHVEIAPKTVRNATADGTSLDGIEGKSLFVRSFKGIGNTRQNVIAERQVHRSRDDCKSKDDSAQHQTALSQRMAQE